MNKASIILIILVSIAVGYTVLHYLGHTNTVETWFNTNVTPTLNWATSQVTGFLNGINTFMKENAWFAPVVGLCGTLSAAGIVNWLKNRSTQTKISSIQNENMQAQNSITQSYSQSLSGLQSQNQTLQTQLTEAKNQLAAIPNIAEMQTAITEKEAQLRNLSGQIELLQTTIKQIKPAEVPIYK